MQRNQVNRERFKVHHPMIWKWASKVDLWVVAMTTHLPTLRKLIRNSRKKVVRHRKMRIIICLDRAWLSMVSFSLNLWIIISGSGPEIKIQDDQTIHGSEKWTTKSNLKNQSIQILIDTVNQDNYLLQRKLHFEKHILP